MFSIMKKQVFNSGLSVAPAFFAKYRRKLLCATAVALLGAGAANAETLKWDAGYCGDDTKCTPKSNVTAAYDPNTKTLTISGIGAMCNYKTKGAISVTTTAPWKDYVSQITTLTIESGVTTIGVGAFGGCKGLTSVTIPDGVTSIGESAFEDCSRVASVSIPSSVTSIGKSTFNSTGITSLTIQGNGVSIGEKAFRKCTKLTSLTIADGIASIGENAFEDCTGLTSVTINDGLATIGKGAFRGCKGLGELIIPQSVASIERGAFDGCPNLVVYVPHSTSVVMPQRVYSAPTPDKPAVLMSATVEKYDPKEGIAEGVAKAKESAAKAKAESGKTADDWFISGMDYYEEKNYEQAIKAFSEFIRISTPKQTSSNEKVQGWVQQTITPTANMIKAHHYRARSYMTINNYDAAIADCEQLLRYVNGGQVRVFALVNLGDCYGAKKEYEKAVQYWEEHLKLKPADEPIDYTVDKNNPSDMWFCATLWRLRYLGNDGKYNEWLNQICSQNPVTRAEIQEFYNKNMKK
ncbi:hypothetical protein FACS189452_04550 [Bacteroidia bacterium]|nr:hypothetical protein FACS189452_04550 [Bacteroidia bacterium]GHT82716.1 hypothetical protein FACS189467_8120 [Bacteroidia bacterium]